MQLIFLDLVDGRECSVLCFNIGHGTGLQCVQDKDIYHAYVCLKRASLFRVDA